MRFFFVRCVDFLLEDKLKKNTQFVFNKLFAGVILLHFRGCKCENYDDLLIVIDGVVWKYSKQQLPATIQHRHDVHILLWFTNRCIQ
jgi:hypothetical protein